MEKRPPSRPHIAWADVNEPQAPRSSRQSNERTRVRVLPHTSWFPMYEFQRDNVNFIVKFIESPRTNTRKQLMFLDNVSELCNYSKNDPSPKGLETFCRTYELLENVRALLEQEPGKQLNLLMLHKCLGAITALSSVRNLLAGKEQDLLRICCSSVFSLPPYEELDGVDTYLCKEVIADMDTLLEALVLSCQVSRVNALLQDIFQILLEYTTSTKPYMQKRVVGRIRMLCAMLARNPSLMNWKCDWQETRCPMSCNEVEIGPLGRVLGQLLLFRSALEAATCPAMDAMFDLTRFLGRQKSRLALVNRENMVIATASAQAWPNITDMFFVELLRRSERTEIIVEVIKGMTASSPFNKMGARDVLNMIIANPNSWLVDVPEIMKCIHDNLESITVVPAQRSVENLLLCMANRSTEEVIRMLLEDVPLRDSASLAMWKVMLSSPQTLEKITKLFLSKLQTKPLHEGTLLAADRACSPSLDSTGTCEFWSEDSDDNDSVRSNAKGRTTMVTACLLLDGLIMLSGIPDMARKLEVLMLDLSRMLNHSNVDIRKRALVFYQNMVANLSTRNNFTIMRVAKKLRPLFDDDSREVREVSIRFFTQLLGCVSWYGRRRMRRQAHHVLLPLFLRMSDPVDEVVQAAVDAVVAIAELLRWQWLKRLAQTQQTWRIAECLLQRDRTMADKYLTQSLLYLQDPEPRLREAAMMFIGLAMQSPGELSQERMAEIGTALRILDRDPNLITRALAAETASLVSARMQRPRPWLTLRSLCCWRR